MLTSSVFHGIVATSFKNLTILAERFGKSFIESPFNNRGDYSAKINVYLDKFAYFL